MAQILNIQTAAMTNFVALITVHKTKVMTQEKVLEALSNVQEPDLGKDLVTLNMVRDIRLQGNDVSFTVVLTTPACPLKDHIRNSCINAIKLLVNKDAVVSVT